MSISLQHYHRPYDEMMVWGSRQTEVEEIVESLNCGGVLAAGNYLRTEEGQRTQHRDYELVYAKAQRRAL